MNSGIFTKPSRTPRETYEKCRLLWRAGKESGAFRAPEPLGWDPLAGTLDLEHIDALIHASEVLPTASRGEGVVIARRVGRLLATLHAHWGHDEAVPVPLEDLLAGHAQESPKALVHGDFGLGNLCFEDGDPERPVILDPEPAPFLDLPVICRAPAILDLAHFASCLEGVFPFRHYARYDWAGIRMRRCALSEGYLEVSGFKHNDADIAFLAGRLLQRMVAFRSEEGRSFKGLCLKAFLKTRAARLAGREG